MHDLVRHYALRQLRRQPADELATRRRHAVYYLDMVAAEAHALPNAPAAQKRAMAKGRRCPRRLALECRPG